MALQSSVKLMLFLAFVSAATLLGTSVEADSPFPFPPPPSGPEPFPISNYDNGHVQSVGKYAVDQYNMRGGPHLYFLEVVNGTVYEVRRALFRVWIIDIKAINCTHSGAPDLYEAQVLEGPGPGLVFADLRKKMK